MATATAIKTMKPLKEILIDALQPELSYGRAVDISLQASYRIPTMERRMREICEAGFAEPIMRVSDRGSKFVAGWKRKGIVAPILPPPFKISVKVAGKTERLL